MKIRNLETFYWVVTLGSFRSASRHQNLTQPAVTARIQMLEQDLGTQVFQRDARHAELTPAGRKLFPYAERLIALDQQILSAFADTTPIVQTVRLGAAETIACSWLPGFLHYVAEATTGIMFELSVDTTNNLRNALVAREIDLAFLMGPVSETSINNHSICDYEMIFAASKPIAVQRAVWNARDIASNRILTFSPDTRPTKEIAALLGSLSQKPLDMTTSTSIGALKELACSGYGICALPRAIINEELTSGVLVELNADISLRNLSFTASYVAGIASAQFVSRIVAHLSEFLSPRIYGDVYRA